jgi:hypothetical protein
LHRIIRDDGEMGVALFRDNWPPSHVTMQFPNVGEPHSDLRRQAAAGQPKREKRAAARVTFISVEHVVVTDLHFRREEQSATFPGGPSIRGTATGGQHV